MCSVLPYLIIIHINYTMVSNIFNIDAPTQQVAKLHQAKAWPDDQLFANFDSAKLYFDHSMSRVSKPVFCFSSNRYVTD